MLPCGCMPTYEGGYGDDGKSGRYGMEWCALHAAAEDMRNTLIVALQRIEWLNTGGPEEPDPTVVRIKALLRRTK